MGILLLRQGFDDLTREGKNLVEKARFHKGYNKTSYGYMLSGTLATATMGLSIYVGMIPIGPFQITAPEFYLNLQRSSTNVSSYVLNNKVLSFPCCTVPFNTVTDAVMIQGSDVHWSVQPLPGLSQW